MHLTQSKLFYRLKVSERQKVTYSRVLNLNKVSKGGVHVYPTLTQHTLYLQTDNAGMLNTFVDIYNNSGGRVKTVMISQLPMRISVGDLAAGVYFLKATLSDRPYVQKFVKQ